MFVNPSINSMYSVHGHQRGYAAGQEKQDRQAVTIHAPSGCEAHFPYAAVHVDLHDTKAKLKDLH